MKNNSSNRQGFTLVEIMIVVAIIGLLATMAIPNFRASRDRANTVACINNLTKIEGAIQIWALENKKDSGQPVGYGDISGYLRNALVCPAGGTRFDDSYTIATVDEKPLCQRKPDSHRLPN
jgi:prepilin-type N-terminal cleavage/methylation domain-containing protein